MTNGMIDSAATRAILGGETELLLRDCFASTELFAKTFYAPLFEKPFSPFIHKKIFSVLDNRRHQKVLFMAPRGVGKTTLTRLYTVRSVLYGDHKFIVPMSATAKHANIESSMMRSMIKENEQVLNVFGDLEPEGRENQWSVERWQTLNGVTMRPRGWGQQTRGMNERIRPDLWLFDDLVDTRHVASEEYRKGMLDRFYSDVINTIDEAKPYRMFYLATPAHEDDLTSHLAEDPEWLVVRLPLGKKTDEVTLVKFTSGHTIEAPVYKSFWPEHMSHAKLTRRAAAYSVRNQMHLFNMELMATISPGEDAVFTQDMFKTYSDAELQKEKGKTIENFVIVDPAKTVEQHSDPTAIVCVGISASERRIYVREVINRRMRPDAIYQSAFALAMKYNARTIGIETTGTNEFILQPFKNYMHSQGHIFQIEELKARRKKEDRIKELAKYYGPRYIYHNTDDGMCDELESQLMSFPRSKHDDIMDALAYIIQIMAHRNRFFFAEAFDGESVDADYSDDEEFYQMVATSYERGLTPNQWGAF